VFTSKNLLSMATSGLRLEHVAVLSFLSEHAEEGEGLQPTCCLPLWDIANQLSLSIDQVKRAVRALTAAGAIARRQAVKIKGEAALTVLTERAVAWLQGRAGRATLPGHLPRALRDLLTFCSPEFVGHVAQAWDRYELLPEAATPPSGLTESDYASIRRALAERIAERAELLAEATAAQAADDALAEEGKVQIRCADGYVVVDRAPFAAQKGALAAVDLRFVRDVLHRVAERAPGLVTVDAVPKLVAEVAYSRVIGYVSRHDAERAQRALVATMARGTWSRPKGIKPGFYAASTAAVRISTGVRETLH